MNEIYWGDNLQVMSHLLKKYRGKVDLVYIDPPFDSKAQYKKNIKLNDNKITNEMNALEEKQYSDIWTNDEYLQFIYERLIIVYELLKENGSIYLHCDWHKVHHLRCIMDEIFGPDRFRNEIIWHYRTGNISEKQFQRKHDNILFYSKGDEIKFNVQEDDLVKSQDEFYDKIIASLRIFVTPLASNYFDFILICQKSGSSEYIYRKRF